MPSTRALTPGTLVSPPTNNHNSPPSSPLLHCSRPLTRAAMYPSPLGSATRRRTLHTSEFWPWRSSKAQWLTFIEDACSTASKEQLCAKQRNTAVPAIPTPTPSCPPNEHWYPSHAPIESLEADRSTTSFIHPESRHALACARRRARTRPAPVQQQPIHPHSYQLGTRSDSPAENKERRPA